MAERIKLTKTSVAGVAPVTGKTTFHWDSELRGFGLRVTGTGIKAFILQSRAGTKERRVTLGRFPDMSPEVARKKARELSGMFAGGVDPVSAKKAADRRSIGLLQAFNNYRDAPVKQGSKRGNPKKEQTRHDIDKAARRFADWHHIAVTAITGDMVRDRHALIAQTSPAQANLAMRYLRAALNHVNADSDEPIILNNPVDRLSRASLWKPVERAKGAIPADRLHDWVEAAQTSLVGLTHDHSHRDALLFMLLTGCRHAEAMGNKKFGYPPLAWPDVDLVKKTVTFRKTKNGNDHTIPIGPKLAGILEARVPLSGKCYVFSNFRDEVAEDLRSARKRIKDATGLHITEHDLRRTFLTIAAYSAGLPEYIVKALANHAKSGDVTAGYLQADVEAMRDAMGKIESLSLQ